MPGYTKSHTYSSTFEPSPFFVKRASLPPQPHGPSLDSSRDASPSQLLAKFLEAHRALESYKYVSMFLASVLILRSGAPEVTEHICRDYLILRAVAIYGGRLPFLSHTFIPGNFYCASPILSCVRFSYMKLVLTNNEQARPAGGG